ncbi:hypothetical protein [Acidovorax sp. SDU_ACID1]|uniref:hypothetical protein n=1 Tax=Acidovorax sp. SDU_ACID1 TaxID=3136632 RepID=UPI0038737238
MRLQIVGEIERRQHYYLTAEHRCYFFGEYTPHEYTNGARAAYSETNQHIGNLKKPPSRRGQTDWPYKGKAIRLAGQRLYDAIKWDAPGMRLATFVPVPPSKTRQDANYDDRILQILNNLNGHLPFDLDIRDMLISDGSLRASHENFERAAPADIRRSLVLNAELARKAPNPKSIFLVDDVLTTGAHFVGISDLLSESFPGVPVIGIFMARTVRPVVENFSLDGFSIE